MDALPEHWLEWERARAQAEAAEVRPYIAVPSPLPAVCFVLEEHREEQQDDGHPVGTRWVTMPNTLVSTSTSFLASGSSASPSVGPIVFVDGAFQAALPQPEVGAYVSIGIAEDLELRANTEAWIPPNARPRRRPL